MGKTVTETTQDTDSITLSRGQKGTYAWEIKCYGNSIGEILVKLREADEKLEAAWGNKEEK